MNNMFKAVLFLSVLSIGIIQTTHASEEKKTNDYMPSLITKTPLEGRNLAIIIVRKTVGTIQRDGAVKHEIRDIYSEDPMMLMRSVELVNKEFAIIAVANNYWR
jgi:Hexameric tyrosine-coordinated heme protein (HTHP)